MGRVNPPPRRAPTYWLPAASLPLLLLLLLAGLLAVVPPSSAARQPLAAEAAAAFRPELGRYSMRVSTASPAAQAAFDEGLNLAFNFNQPMAADAFARCSAEDRSAAMCHWGRAYAAGPFLNAPRKPRAVLLAGRQAAHAAAAALSPDAPAKEAGLVRAMAVRYPAHPTDDDIPLDSYAAYEVCAQPRQAGVGRGAPSARGR